MADKQLTVAELLARAEKENPSGARRPRRRRSLEDGGVSVAELTDSFKKVEAKPAEVKHSSVPIDAPSDTPKKTPTQAPKPEPTPAAPKPEPKPVSKVAPKPVQKAETKVAPKPADKPAQAESVKLRPAAKPAEQAPKPAEKPAAAPVSKPVSKPVDKPAPAPAASTTTKVQPASDDTTVLRKVEAEPEDEAKPEGKAEPVVKQELAQSDDTGEIRTVDAPEPQAREDSLDAPEAEYDTDYEVEEASVNPILLVLLVFFGVLLGVLGFLAFKWLWANTMAIVAVLVGGAAVAAVVAAVGAMAGSRDKVTMIIAGLAAAVVAFGPALL